MKVFQIDSGEEVLYAVATRLAGWKCLDRQAERGQKPTRWIHTSVLPDYIELRQLLAQLPARLPCHPSKFLSNCLHLRSLELP